MSVSPKMSFWRRRLIQPLRAQLTHGTTPDRLAATLAIGVVCSLFPFIGFTSLLNLAVGLALRLNQPILQILNQLLGPVQLGLIYPFIRGGEWLWSAPAQPFSVVEMRRIFSEESFGEFMQRFGGLGVYALSAWLLTVPIMVGALYFSLRPIVRRLATVSPTNGASL